jgi:hypothetical protein
MYILQKVLDRNVYLGGIVCTQSCAAAAPHAHWTYPTKLSQAPGEKYTFRECHNLDNSTLQPVHEKLVLLENSLVPSLIVTCNTSSAGAKIHAEDGLHDAAHVLVA